MGDKPQLHATALEMKCLEQFRRRYIEGEKIPPGIAAIIGTGTDKSVTRNLEHKIQTKGGLLSLEELADIASDGVNQAWASGVRLQPEEVEQGIKKVKGEAVDKAVRLAKLHGSKMAPIIQPVQVQRKWTLDLTGHDVALVGAIDIQESNTIRDTKTSGKTPAADCAERSLQLKTYATAIKIIDGTMPEKVVLDYLVDKAKPDTAIFEHRPSDDDTRLVLARVEILLKCMDAGLFPPVEPTHWICNPRWCGYAGTCRYFLGKPKQFSV